MVHPRINENQVSDPSSQTIGIANEFHRYQEYGKTNGSDMIKEDAASGKMFHGKVDWDVVKRFLRAISLCGPIRKTRLAMKTGVNSSTCKRYLTWMIEVRWVMTNNLGEYVLTEAGIEVSKNIDWENGIPV